MMPKEFFKCVNTQDFEYFAHSVSYSIPFTVHFYRLKSLTIAKHLKITNNKEIKVAFAGSMCIFEFQRSVHFSFGFSVRGLSFTRNFNARKLGELYANHGVC